MRAGLVPTTDRTLSVLKRSKSWPKLADFAGTWPKRKVLCFTQPYLTSWCMVIWHKIKRYTAFQKYFRIFMIFSIWTVFVLAKKYLYKRLVSVVDKAVEKLFCEGGFCTWFMGAYGLSGARMQVNAHTYLGTQLIVALKPRPVTVESLLKVSEARSLIEVIVFSEK